MTERKEFIDSLRRLADFLEEHPQLPVPGYNMSFNVFLPDREAMTAVIRGTGMWEKSYADAYFALVKRFGNITFEVNINREQVCRKIVIGTRVVPAREEHTVEDVEWKCDDAVIMGATI